MYVAAAGWAPASSAAARTTVESRFISLLRRLRAGADLHDRISILVHEAGAGSRRSAAVDHRRQQEVHALLERNRLGGAVLILFGAAAADEPLDLLAVEPPGGAVVRPGEQRQLREIRVRDN